MTAWTVYGAATLGTAGFVALMGVGCGIATLIDRWKERNDR